MLNESARANMEKVCRSCMCENAENILFKNLFEAKVIEEENSTLLAQIIMSCASVEIFNGDGLPDCLCEECEMKLMVAYQFKRQCERSDVILRQLEKESKIEIEIKPYDEDDVPDYSDADDSKPDELKCAYCPKTLRSKKGLKLHEKTHGNDKYVVCDVCQVKVPTADYDFHVESHKGENSEFKHACGECGLSFQRAYHLTKHKREHKGETIIIKQEDDDDDEVKADEYADVPDKVKFECKDCHKLLSTLEGYKIHVRKHTGEKLFNCNICDKSFTKSSHLKRHIRSLHDDFTPEIDKPIEKKVMECEFCDRKFKYKKSFAHHMQTEHGMEENDDSDTPLIEFVHPEELTVAVDINVNDSPNDESKVDDPDYQESLKEARKSHKCHVCDAQFTRSNHLTRHMTLHRAVLVHKCDHCDKAFASQDFLDQHHREEHINKPYTCTVCNRTFSRGEHLIRHLKVHIPSGDKSTSLKCSVCTKEFTRSDHLARHIKVHLQQDKRHVCSECGKAFNRLDNLKTHQRIHTGQRDNSKLHLCIYCGKEFNNSSNMIVHMRRHTGERPYKCSQCDKGFPRSHDLKCHERTHSGEKPYLCTLCGKSFNKSNKLLRHTRVHTGERPYVCSLCGRGFTQSNDLALHMRRHTGSRPYACGVCPARFIQSGQLKTHRRSTGHWMETQPDLKGAHRVEPVIPLTEPTPIKFKTHGKNKPAEGGSKSDEPNGSMGNVSAHSMEQFAQMGDFPGVSEAEKPKLVVDDGTFHTYTAAPTSGTFDNSETYNFHTYG